MRKLPKVYEFKDYVFRSKIDLRWAMFFENIGWNWEYKKLKTVNWTPDFELKFNNHNILIDIENTSFCQNISRDQIELLKWKREIFKFNKSKADHIMIFSNKPDFERESGIVTLGFKFSKDDEKFYPVRVTYKPELEKAWINSFNQTSSLQAIQKRAWTRGQLLPPMTR